MNTKRGRGPEKRREGLEIEAVDPASGKPIVALISQRRLEAAARRSEGQVLEAAYVVPQALQRPTAVFEGLKREGDEPHRRGAAGWRCYCTIPDRAYDKDGQRHDPWDNEVFMAFVDDERIVYNWYWYQSDRENERLPDDYGNRFERQLL